MRGYIYVVEAEEVSRIKIGRSFSYDGVIRRFNSFQCGTPCALSIHSISGHENCIKAESYFHKRFKLARVRREWFDTDDPMIKEWLANRIKEGFAFGADIEVALQYGDRGRPPSKLVEAVEFLITFLDDRPNQKAPASEVISVAANHGISLRTLENAKKKLQVISVKRSNGWWWILP